MMVTLHNGFRDVQRREATQVVVEDALGNPVAVAVEISPGFILAATADVGQPEWDGILRTLGLDKTVRLVDAELKPVTGIQISP